MIGSPLSPRVVPKTRLVTNTSARIVGWLLTALCFSFSSFQLPAQELPFERLSSELGLSQNMVTCLLQDQKGFLWVGTKDGLNRFDGYRFKVFRSDPFDLRTLSHNYVNSLLQDSTGHIWVATFEGLNRFNPATEVFERVRLLPTRGNQLPQNKVIYLYQDRNHRIWLITDDFGLHFLRPIPDSQAYEIHTVKTMLDQRTSRPRSILAERIIQESTGTFWLYARDGLYRFGESEGHFWIDDGFEDASDEQWKKTLESVDDQPGGYFRIGEGQNGSVWVLAGNRIGRWQPNAGAWDLYDLPAFLDPTDPFLWDGAFDILEDRDNRLWVTFINGLFTLDIRTGETTWMGSSAQSGHPLQAGAGPLLEDQSGLVWVGTKGYGLLKFNRQARRFAGARPEIDSSFLYQGKSLRAIRKMENGEIWVSATGSGLYRFDSTSGELKPVMITHRKVQREAVFCIFQDQPEEVWLGGTSGLLRLEAQANGTWTVKRTYLPIPFDDEPRNTYVWKIIRGQDGALWMLSSTHLYRFDPQSEVFIRYPYLPSVQLTIINNEFPVLYEDHLGFMWIGTSEGLLQFSPITQQFIHYKNDPGNPATLNQNRIKSVVSDPTHPDQILWVGTAGGGLNRLDRDSGNFTHFTEEDGLPDNVLYALLPDREGHLWISTNRGLGVFSTQDFEVRTFQEKDGLQNLEFNSGAAFRADDGQLFFGGINGFNAFYPKAMLTTNRHIPPLALIDFKLANQRVVQGEEESPLQKAIPWASEIHLKFENKSLYFEFAALDFSDPSQNRFAYKMEGFDNEWQHNGFQNSATYTNLQPGRYTFRVKGANQDGVWNEKGIALDLFIQAPWWRTGWALAGYIVLLIGVLAFFRHKEIQQQKLKHKLVLEQAEAQRQKELNDAKSVFLSTVSHELRTPLTSIMGFSKIVKKRLQERILPDMDLSDPRRDRAVRQVLDNLEIIDSESERLTALINQVLDLAKIEAGKVHWREERVDMREVIERGISFLRNQFYEKGIKLNSEIEENLPPVAGTPDQLLQVVINLLSNALKFTEKGRVVCWARQKGGQVLVSIKDTGIGISPEDQETIFDKFKQIGTDHLTGKPGGTGLGLTIAREIILRHGGTISVQSTPKQGSSFTFTLPLYQK